MAHKAWDDARIARWGGGASVANTDLQEALAPACLQHKKWTYVTLLSIPLEPTAQGGIGQGGIDKKEWNLCVLGTPQTLR